MTVEKMLHALHTCNVEDIKYYLRLFETFYM